MVEETTFKYPLAVLSILLCPENVLVPNLSDRTTKRRKAAERTYLRHSVVDIVPACPEEVPIAALSGLSFRFGPAMGFARRLDHCFQVQFVVNELLHTIIGRLTHCCSSPCSCNWPLGESESTIQHVCG